MIRPTMSHALNKDDLYELMGKYANHLENEIAKANERVKELEHEKEGLNLRLGKQKEIIALSQELNENLNKQLTQVDKREKDFIAYMHDAQKFFTKHDPMGQLQRSHPKAIEQLNKFAIEQQIKALEAVESTVLNFSQADEPVSYEQALDEHLEQLRKEQEL